MLQIVRAEAERRGKAVAVLLDLQGPKIRVGKFANGQIELEPGAEFTITTERACSATSSASRRRTRCCRAT